MDLNVRSALSMVAVVSAMLVASCDRLRMPRGEEDLTARPPPSAIPSPVRQSPEQPDPLPGSPFGEARNEGLAGVAQVVEAMGRCGRERYDACVADIEGRVIARSAGRVVRKGASICIAPKQVVPVCVEASHDVGDDFIAYTYLGQLASPAVHVLRVSYYEGRGALLVDAITGDRHHVSAVPVPSPDGARLAVASMDMDAAFDPNEFVIYRYDDGGLTQELKVSPTDWGPGTPRWLDASRVEVPVESSTGEAPGHRVTGKRTYDLDWQGRWRETVSVASDSDLSVP